MSHKSTPTQKTVLVVSSDPAVLVLMRGILQNDCRVVLAPDAESAVRLLTIDGVRIDVAVIDRNVRSSRKGGLRRSLTDILPQLRVVSMAGMVQDGVIRLHARSRSNRRNSDLVQEIRAALAGAGRNHAAGRAQASGKIPGVATKNVMVAGNA